MAEGVLIGLAKSVLEQLSSPAMEELMLLWNSKKQLKRLKETVETINDVLHDAEQRRSGESRVEGWLVRLREVMYQADDLFDEIAAMALRKKTMTDSAFKKEVRLFFSKSNQLGFNFKIAHEIKEIRETLDGIANDISQFNFIKQQVEEKPVKLLHRKETHSFVREKDVIGRDQEKEEIIKLLLPEDHRGEETYRQELSVITIIGFGGLGKTTLAQFVYNDDRVQRGFDLCLWVCVNYFSDLREVLIAILTSAIKSKLDGLNLDKLQEKLRGHIGGKKYLLVLDDVWDEDALNWHNLKPILDCGKSGCKVLVTTRSIKVAKCLDAYKPYYRLNVMSEESAWSLFVKMAFEEGELGKDPELEPLGRRIVRKCGYVPLSLITIGSLLRCKEKEKKMWFNELGDVLSDDSDNKIMQALKVSYNDLPVALKHCFAYCSLFPKDYRFDKDELVRLWISQGFLDSPSSKQKQSLEKVAEAYFHYLVDRCFFQEVIRYSENGCYRYTCKMHDLMHDLAEQVAGSEIKSFGNKVHNEIGGMSTLRHISVQDGVGPSFDYSSLLSHSEGLRTLLLFSRVNLLNTKVLNTLVGRFRMLRTLEFSSWGIDKLPDSTGELIHLRYLDISRNRRLKVLPNSICKLCHLQILRLEGCLSLKELPSDIRKLMSLRHLFLADCEQLSSLPSGLAALTSLVTLDRLIVHCRSGGLRYLDCLDNLCGTLRVELPAEGWSNAIEDAKKSNMSRKHNLNRMIIQWPKSNLSGAPEMAKAEAESVLEALQPHDNLQYLEISFYDGNALSSWAFSLQNVKELNLEGFTLEYLSDKARSESFFPSLEILQIKGMPNLKGWWRQVPVRERLPLLPRVSEVVIQRCPKLTESMPLFGGIEKLVLKQVNEKLVRVLLTGNTNCCPSSSSSSGCQSNSRLKELRLSKIEGLTSLPEDWIRHFTALRNLKITSCDELNWVSCGGLSHLTALEKLSISNCKIAALLDKYDETVLENDVGMLMPWKSLQSLRVLRLPIGDGHLQKGFQYLTALEKAEIGNWEEETETETEDDGMSWKSLERLPKGIQYVPSLKYLTVSNCKELSLSWTTVGNLKLHSLSLYGVDNLVNVNEMVEEEQMPITSLTRLRIESSEKADWIHRNIPWKLLPSLRGLTLWEVSNLRSLPDGIQHLTSLQDLSIDGCKEMTTLPNWMVNLTSLQWLNIECCSPELHKRLKTETGLDWSLISHIPYKFVDGLHVYGNGNDLIEKQLVLLLILPLQSLDFPQILQA